MGITVDLEVQELVDLYFAVRRNIDPANKALADKLLPHVMATVGEVVRVPLTKGYYALIDRDDLELVAGYNWFVLETKQGGELVNECVYAGTRIRNAEGKQTTMRMHRLIANVADDAMVDHINHNGLDNRRSNLRAASRAENGHNRRGHRGASSRYKGVSLDGSRVRQGKKTVWQASIRWTEDGVKKHKKLGCFASEVEAALAYNAAAIERFGRFACLNEIEPASDGSGVEVEQEAA